MTSSNKPTKQLRPVTKTASFPLQSTIETEQIYHYWDVTASCFHSNWWWPSWRAQMEVLFKWFSECGGEEICHRWNVDLI